MFHFNITHNFKFDDSYLIHKFLSIIYTNYYVCVCVCVCVCCVCVKMWIISKDKIRILLLNNVSMTVLWKKISNTWFVGNTRINKINFSYFKLWFDLWIYIIQNFSNISLFINNFKFRNIKNVFILSILSWFIHLIYIF